MNNGSWDEEQLFPDFDQEAVRGTGNGLPEIKKVIFQQLKDENPAAPQKGIAPGFHAVNLKISAELGKVKLKVRELINLEEGSVLKLNRVADEKVIILVNDTPFAHGEIVVINDRFGVRVTSLVDRDNDEESDSVRGKNGA